MVDIYIIACENNKYYIGKTNNISNIMNEHYNGAEFTKLYKPIKLINVIKNGDNFEEDKQVKKYMSIYGIENVRGGSYSTIELADYQIKSLEQELLFIKDICYKCGEEEHSAKDCDKIIYEKLKKENQKLVIQLKEKDERIKELEIFIQSLENENNKNVCVYGNKKVENLFLWCSNNSSFMQIWLLDIINKKSYHYDHNRILEMSFKDLEELTKPRKDPITNFLLHAGHRDNIKLLDTNLYKIYICPQRNMQISIYDINDMKKYITSIIN